MAIIHQIQKHNFPPHFYRPSLQVYYGVMVSIFGYRMSTKTVPTYVYWIYWLPRGLKIPSWTFFNIPLMSLATWSNEHSWELKSRHVHGAMRIWVLINTHEHSWPHSTMLISDCGCSWAHLSTYGSSWALTTGHECWTVSLNNKQKMLSFKMTSL